MTVPKSGPERSAYFRDLVARRWAKPRPEPKIRRGARTLPAASDQEAFWDARAREFGLTDAGMSRTSWRRLLKRLADAEVARLADPTPHTGNPDDDLLLTYLQREATSMRARARRDRELADVHDRAANEAEARLVDHMRRLGLA